MSDAHTTSLSIHQEPSKNATLDPIVCTRNGVVFADSRDVAAYFRRQHRHVLEAIRELHCSSDFRVAHFRPIKIKDLTGESTSHVEMTKNGFAFLAFGFTGAAAGVFKEAYIVRFDEMEEELRARPSAVIPDLSDPAVLLRLLTEQAAGRIEDQRRAAEAEASVAAMEPKVAALDRIAEAHGSFCRTTAAKMLGIPPHTLCRWMRTNGWTYRRLGDKDDHAYQAKMQAGLLEHKISTGARLDGTEWSSTQVRVTPKGMTVLGSAFPPIARVA